MRNKFFIVCALAAFAAMCSSAVGQPMYQIVDLGYVSAGDSMAQAFGVSTNGVACGRSMPDSFKAFTWSQTGGIVGLDKLDGRNFAVANAVNDMGQAAGNATTTFTGSGALPVLWTNGAATQLPLTSGQTIGRAAGINDNGTVVGSVGSGSGEYGVYWTNGAVNAITTTTAEGAYMMRSKDINNNGFAVGEGVDPNDLARRVGLLYDTINDTMIEIPALVDDNGTNAAAISENGYIVGTSSHNGASPMPFLYDALNGTIPIPVPTGSSVATADDVNSDGWVVGTGSGTYAVPYLWDGSATYRLQDLIDSTSGWDLSQNTTASAQGISDNGIIVGTGIYSGAPHAYAMIPVPEPTTLSFLLVGSLALLRRRR